MFYQSSQKGRRIGEQKDAVNASLLLQRKCGCGGSSSLAGCMCDGKELQKKADSPSHADHSVPPIVHEVLRSPGQPLETPTRAYMESWFGHDFSRVRVHTDARATESAQAVNALAYTVGRDIVFGPERYSPGTGEGRKLLAHELTHTIQQSTASSLMTSSAQINEEGDAYEREADQVSNAFTSGLPASVHLRQSSSVIQRQTGITVKEAKPFGHADLDDDELKQKFRTYIGSVTLMQVTPSGNYKGHCVKEYLTEVANTCPARFAELRKTAFCTESKCLEFDKHGTSGDPESSKTVTDGPDTFIDRHRTSHTESLLEGTGKSECSVVCHQRYKYDRKTDLGSFYVIRNFKAGKYTPPGAKDALHITTVQVRKVPADLEAPTKEKFAKDIAPGLVKSGDLASAPPAPKATTTPKRDK